MTAQTLTLTDFLLARIAEDEADASGIDYDPRVADLPYGSLAPHHPRRLLAECEAKRRIVEDLRELIDYDRDRFIVSPQVESVCGRTLAALALPYADHPDYNPDWRP